MTDVVQETTDLVTTLRDVALLAPLIGLLVTWMLVMLSMCAADYLGKIDITRMLRAQDRSDAEKWTLAAAIVACSCFTVILAGRLLGGWAVLTTAFAHLYFYGWQCQSACTKAQIKLACAAAWNRFVAAANPGQGRAVLEQLQAMQQQLDQLAHWVSLPEELRRQRPLLIQSVTESAARLSEAVGKLNAKSFAASDIATHVEGLKRHGISAELIAGLEKVIAGCKAAVDAQKGLLAQESEAVATASEALNQHLIECNRKRPTAKEALEQAAAAVASARQALLAN